MKPAWSYMGILSAAKIREQLLDAGYSPDLPYSNYDESDPFSGQKVIHYLSR